MGVNHAGRVVREGEQEDHVAHLHTQVVELVMRGKSGAKFLFDLLYPHSLNPFPLPQNQNRFSNDEPLRKY